MADGCSRALSKLEDGADGEEVVIDEAVAAVVPLVADKAATEGSASSFKGMRHRAVALAFSAVLSVAALLVVSTSGRPGGLLQPAEHSADPPPGHIADELLEEVAVSCLPMEQGVDYIGGQGKAVANVQGPDACRAKCLAVPTCTMWTWVAGTGIPLTPTQCWVKSGIMHRQVRVLLPGPKVLNNYWSGCIQKRIVKVVPTSPYTLNYQADHAAGEVPGLGCGPPGPLPAVWTAAPRAGPPVEVAMLTYNLAWWMVFDHARPAELYFHEMTQGNAAMGLIKAVATRRSLDIMAFQECNNIEWLLRTSGLLGMYAGFQGPEGVCIAYRTAVWTQLAQGQAVVAEDTKAEYWGRRLAQWMRLSHKGTGKTLFFMNHHGPLPVSSGGVCGAPATVRRLLSMVTASAHPGEPVILVGDFNADRASQTIGLLKSHLNMVFAGTMHNGIDNIFSNLAPSTVVATAQLGSGGSDHNALHAKIRI